MPKQDVNMGKFNNKIKDTSELMSLKIEFHREVVASGSSKHLSSSFPNAAVVREKKEFHDPIF